jgi:hypothetical protein
MDEFIIQHKDINDNIKNLESVILNEEKKNLM